jgi:GYF domain 2
MSTEWYYAKDNQQLGPIPASQLKQLATSGQLSPDDLVWKEGMAEWSPAGRVKGLFDAPAAAAAPMAAATPAAAREPQRGYVPPSQAYGQAASTIGYYSATSDIGARTAQILKGFPSPTGPRGDWPLSDSHLAQLATAEKHRKVLRNFNNLCNVLTLLCVIGAVVALIMLVTAGSGPSAMRNPLMMAGATGLAIYAGLGVLFFICGRVALKCRIWGPITVCVFLVLGILLALVGAFMPSRSQNDQIASIIVAAFTLLIGGAFLWTTVRAIIAIPKFLACPVWTQEALVNAKL